MLNKLRFCIFLICSALVAGGISAAKSDEKTHREFVAARQRVASNEKGTMVCSGFIHPGKSTWNPKMEVWKMIFLFNWVIFRFQTFMAVGDEILPRLCRGYTNSMYKDHIIKQLGFTGK